MSLKGIATETVRFQDEGRFTTAEGVTVDFAQAQQAAVEGTRLYTPDQLADLRHRSPARAGPRPTIEVTDETTQIAAHRLVTLEGVEDPVLLNFASARNPGGGFLRGAKAQEEDLTRCSGLYRSLMTQMTYYEVNRAQDSMLYTDHMIYSPKVPWFRTRSRSLLDYTFEASVITAPAPNAGQHLRRHPDGFADITQALERRAACVLALAEDQGHRTLLLGAWGCGVFMNQPAEVADIFGRHLHSERFAGAFDRVVFAVYDRSKTRATLEAFQNRLGGGAPA